MRQFQFKDRIAALEVAIKRKGFSFDPRLFSHNINTSDAPPNQLKILSSALVDNFDSPTLRWIEKIHDKDYLPDWYAIYVTEETPIPLIDFIQAAPSRAEALGYVLQSMDSVRAKPSGFVFSENGTITISGETSVIAQIAKIKFATFTETAISRVETALKNVHKIDSLYFLTKRLSKIDGYSVIESSETLVRGWDLGMLDLNCNNLCTCMQMALHPVIQEELTRSQAQEFVAVFLGFESWNHFVGAVKSRSEFALNPFYLSNVENQKTDFGESLRFYKGLPQGLLGFGKLLALQTKKDWSFDNSFTGIELTTVTHSNDEVFRITNSPYSDPNGIELKEMLITECDEHYKELAAIILSSGDSEAVFEEYFFAGLDAEQRIIEFNKRIGVAPSDNLFIGDWVYWANRNYGDGVFSAEKISEIGRDIFPKIEAYLHKASLQKNDKGEFWLATDWDRKPKYLLEGLTDESADLIEKTFFARENWRRSRFL